MIPDKARLLWAGNTGRNRRVSRSDLGRTLRYRTGWRFPRNQTTKILSIHHKILKETNFNLLRLRRNNVDSYLSKNHLTVKFSLHVPESLDKKQASPGNSPQPTNSGEPFNKSPASGDAAVVATAVAFSSSGITSFGSRASETPSGQQP